MVRLKQKEIQNAIKPVNVNRKKRLKENKVRVFTIVGKEDAVEDGLPILLDTRKVNAVDKNTACAKRVFNGIETRYYIKKRKDGRLINLAGTEEIDGRSKLRKEIDPWIFSEVSELTFSKYLKFLQTRVPQWLKLAERDIM